MKKKKIEFLKKRYQKMAFKVYIDPPFGIKDDPPVDTSIDFFHRIKKA